MFSRKDNKSKLNKLDLLRSKRIDLAELILLSLKIIENEKANSSLDTVEFEEKLEQIRRAFVSLDYNAALEAIVSIAQSLDSLELASTISNNVEATRKLSSPEQNFGRRYFENNLSNRIWGIVNNQSCYNSMGKFAKFMSAANQRVAEEEHLTSLKKINGLDDIEHIFVAMRRIGEETKVFQENHNQIRTSPGSISSRKDRGTQREKSDVGYTMNPGIIKANTPMPRDELRESPVPGTLVDTFTINRKVKNGYSASNVDVPFVNSVSGTTYTFVSILQEYINENSDDPELQKDIDNIIQTFVGFMVKSGFHSFSEIMDVFDSEQVQNIFNNANLKFNNLFPEDLVAKAVKKAAQYVETKTLGHLMRDELKSVKSPDGDEDNNVKPKFGN